MTNDSILDSFVKCWTAFLPLVTLDLCHPLPYGDIILGVFMALGVGIVIRLLYVLIRRRKRQMPLLEKYVSDMIIGPYSIFLCDAIASCYIETGYIGILAALIYAGTTTTNFVLDLVKKRKEDEEVTSN